MCICHHFLLMYTCHSAAPWVEKAKLIWNHWKRISPAKHEYYVVSHTVFTLCVYCNALVAVETKSLWFANVSMSVCQYVVVYYLMLHIVYLESKLTCVCFFFFFLFRTRQRKID